ncbi:GNAT family N-acetyltransferase [Ruegeria conchae]|uniref:GNAT family N-acetyltransferase n=1 Tax=Ruegeria conchae TaxID=981384 RepID=UPI001480BB49|nr:GNAT family N-acetyltransferase [Ruegeria conchae]UWR01695.1 GNAT family N-acetyltransferase [Ruegeria conchae]
MSIATICPSQAHRLLPLLQQVHDLHVQNQPQRYAPLPDDKEVVSYLSEWLSHDAVVALGYEENQILLGYAIFELEKRAATPFRRAETRAMLHHISVDTKHRRKGIGLALINEVRARLLADGGDVLATTYATFNTPSAELMARAGLNPLISFAEWRVE